MSSAAESASATAAPVDPPAPTTDSAQVNPWEVADEVDYDKLMREFGASAITDEVIDRVERLTKQPAHPWLRRGVFYSHRDLNVILDLFEQGKDFYLYTGRGPSSEALHLGHLVPFHFTKYLQDAFNVPLVIQLTDDEKTLWKELEFEEARRLGRANARDIIACGFDMKKTFIFSDADYIGDLLPNILNIQQRVTINQVRGIFGFDDTKNIGQIAFPAVQAAPSFSTSFPVPLKGAANMPCLIPCAIDQDPYFKMTRAVAPRMKLHKPALIHSKFFPALQGAKSKMSASNVSSAIYVTDSDSEIRSKIQEHAYVDPNAELGDISGNVPFQWLSFFQADDAKLAEVEAGLKDGSVSNEVVKEKLIEQLEVIVHEHQKNRALVTDEIVDEFMSVRPLEW
jgi:tryptophanyl-tRNA synthetase